jgi:hypothetical protein
LSVEESVALAGIAASEADVDGGNVGILQSLRCLLPLSNTLLSRPHS